MFMSFAYKETTTYPKIIVTETSLMALMKGIELHNTKPGLKECLHVFLGFCHGFLGFAGKMLTLHWS